MRQIGSSQRVPFVARMRSAFFAVACRLGHHSWETMGNDASFAAVQLLQGMRHSKLITAAYVVAAHALAPSVFTVKVCRHCNTRRRNP